jgi:hypothetical protein
LVPVKARERLTVNKRVVTKKGMVRLNLKKLNEGRVKEQYQVTIKKKFAVLGNLGDNGDINRAWNTIRENKKILPICVSSIVNQSNINHVFMWNVQNWLIEESKLNYSCCSTKGKRIKET